MTPSPIIVWAFTDGKAGHEAQTRGLLAALARHRTLDTRWIKVPAYSSLLTNLMTKRFLPGAALPSPDLLIGAGHRTHLPLIAARRARGGRSVVLMKPSLPRVWFDLCVIPEHDAASGANVIATRGALNSMQPGIKNSSAGLILVGGPSRHHAWAEQELMTQIETVLTREREIHWTLTTSRRTPPSTTVRLRALAHPNLAVVPVAETGPGWLPERLAVAAQVWVTEDSVSMVYEALTAGCATGLIAVPARRSGRLTRGLDALVRAKQVTRFSDWQSGTRLTAPGKTFNEATRVAEWIVDRWLNAA